MYHVLFNRTNHVRVNQTTEEWSTLNLMVFNCELILFIVSIVALFRICSSQFSFQSCVLLLMLFTSIVQAQEGSYPLL